MRKETEALLDELKNSGEEGWVIVDWGEAEVIDMINEAIGRLDFGTKAEKEFLETLKEYEEEAIKWAEEEGFPIDYNVPIRIYIDK